jgi:hypothetical protein
VLMALIGTAFITTARTDRFSAQQNALNTEIDLLVQGVINMAEAAMTTTAHEQAGGQHWDDTRTDTWLTARIPGYFSDACGPYVMGHTYARGDLIVSPYDPTNLAANNSSTVYISLVDGNTAAPGGATWGKLPNNFQAFSSIQAWPALSAPLAANTQYEDPRFPFQTYSGHNVSQPGTTAVPTFVTFGGKNYPALQFFDTSTGTATPVTLLAASASGDGIADAFLWRLPIGEINGVTYYAATRIIDNSAAINLNTALSSTWDFDFQGTATRTLSPVHLSPGIFTSNIGLAETLKTFNPSATSYQTLGSEMVALSKFRSGIAQGNALTLPDGMVGDSYYQLDESNGSQRQDFKFNTLEEAIFMGLGRRVNHPGYFSHISPFYQALTWGDAAALAFRFELVNANASPTTSETWLSQSLYNLTASTTYQSVPYDPGRPGDQLKWIQSFQGQIYGQPYAMPNPQFCLRPFVTTHNPLNNLLPVHANASLFPPNYQPLMLGSAYTANPNTIPRVSLDTADVLANDFNPSKRPCLWLGFFNAMYDGTTPVDPKVPNGAPLYQQFRSSLRDPTVRAPNTLGTTYFTPTQQVWLRSLIAALNAQDLRDSDDDVSSRTVQLQATVAGNANTPVNVTVFGTERQPYITEVYANNDVSMQKAFLPDANGDDSQTANPNAQKQNPKGYVAVELHNPYSVPISLNGWQLGILTRSTSAAKNPYPTMMMKQITGFTGFGPTATPAITIPANGYAVLENFQATPAANPPPAGGGPSNDAQYRPFINYAGYTVPTNAIYIYVPNLHEVFSDPASTNPDGQPGGELYLLRPRSANGTLLQGENSLASLVPADSFDFSGTLVIPGPAGTVFQDMHYVRANGNLPAGPPSPTNNNLWRFVYPGRWTPAADGTPRQEGIYLSPTWDITAMKPLPHTDPWIITPPAGGAGPNVLPANDGSAGPAGAPINLGNPDPSPSYSNKFPAIQLNNTDFGGPNKLYTGNPINTFPYGGFARLGDVLQVPFIGGYTVTDTAGNIVEMNAVTTDSAFADDNDNGTDDTVEQVGRFCPLAAADPLHKAFNPTNAPGFIDPYGWAASLMDNFTAIANPHDDYLPNTDPNRYASPLEYQTPAATPPTPTRVPNFSKLTAFNANQGAEDLAPIEGLININTAPFAVLRRVPFIPANPTLNDQIALAIVTYRNSNGPYKTLFDLNSVPGFQNAYGDPSAPTMTSNYDSGDLSTVGPSGTQSDGVANDFEKRFMEMTRVSNLLTTRSDTYTAYILVQGWRGIGTATPELVVQRRAAFIADRSGLTVTNKSLNVVNVQAN